MKKTTIIEMRDPDHGLFGVGKVTYTITQEGNAKEVRILIAGRELPVIKGDEAKKISSKMVLDMSRATVYLVKKLAARATGIPVDEINATSRSPVYFWARVFVYYYLVTVLDFTLGEAAAEVGGPKNHATISSAIKNYEKETKYLKPEEADWKRTFEMLLRQNDMGICTGQ